MPLNKNITNFLESPVTHVVSLGYNCQVTYNIRKIFLVKHAYPLDWWISPPFALLNFLSNPDVNDLYDEKKLTVINGRDTVLNPDFGIQYHHDFLRDSKNKISEDYLKDLEDVKRKFSFIIDRFLKLNNPDYRVLFIRTNGFGALENEVFCRLNQLFLVLDFSVLSFNEPSSEGFDWTGNESAYRSIFFDQYDIKIKSVE